MDPYQALAQIVVAQCAPGYERIHLEAELDEDYAEIDVKCVDASGGRSAVNLPDMVMHDAFERLDDIRQEMGQVSGSKWKTCVFTVFPDGKFSFNVGY